MVPRSAPSASTLQVARQVDQGEEHVAHLLLDLRLVPGRDGRVELAHLLGDLGPRARGVLPVEADARHLLADALRARERRHAAGNAGEDAALALLLGLELLPVAQHLVGVLGRQVAEDVGMTMNELVHDAGHDVVDGERSPPGAPSSAWKTTCSRRSPSSSRMALRSPESMASMTSHASSRHVLAQRLEGLLPVPGAAVGGEQAPHEADQAGQGGAVLLARAGAPGAGRPRRNEGGAPLVDTGARQGRVAPFRHGARQATVAGGNVDLAPLPRRPPLIPMVSPAVRRGLTFAFFVGMALLGYLLRGVLVPLFFAFLLAYALDPFVDWLEARKVPRTRGRAPGHARHRGLLFVLFLFFAIPVFVDELRDASADLPDAAAGARGAASSRGCGRRSTSSPRTR